MERLRFIMSQIWDFLRPFILQMMSQAGQVLAQSAMAAVAAVAVSMQEADGEAKRRQAFDLIQADLTKAGIQIAASTINAAIEAAVVKMKAGG